MVAPIERIYELALRALDEQERQINDARASVPPLLAAGGLGATLLAQPAFGGGHPRGPWELTAVAVGLLGAAFLICAVLVLLRSTSIAFSVDAPRMLAVAPDTAGLGTRVAWTEQQFYEVTARSLARRRGANVPTVKRLRTALDLALFALAIELVGLASAAALAS